MKIIFTLAYINNLVSIVLLALSHNLMAVVWAISSLIWMTGVLMAYKYFVWN